MMYLFKNENCFCTSSLSNSTISISSLFNSSFFSSIVFLISLKSFSNVLVSKNSKLNSVAFSINKSKLTKYSGIIFLYFQ